MIRNPELWRAWQDEQIRREPVDFQKNLRIANAMLKQARAMGAIPLKDPLEGLDVKIRVAKVLNARIPADESSEEA